jgi:hypothetical protein
MPEPHKNYQVWQREILLSLKNPKPETLNTELSLRNPKPEILNTECVRTGIGGCGKKKYKATNGVSVHGDAQLMHVHVCVWIERMFVRV